MNNIRKCFRNRCGRLFFTRTEERGCHSFGLCRNCAEVFMDILCDDEMETTMITTEQRVWVAKDRACDERTDIIDSAKGYWNLTDENRGFVQKICRLLSLPDDCEETLVALDSYINGEEEFYYESS